MSKGTKYVKAKDVTRSCVFRELSMVQFCSRRKCKMNLERWWGERSPAQKGLAEHGKIFRLGRTMEEYSRGVTDHTRMWKTSLQPCGLRQQFGRGGGIEAG